MSGTLHLVAPESLRHWFGAFHAHEPGDAVRFIGEGPRIGAAVRSATADAAAFARVELLSGHDSLRRDQRLAAQMRAAGADVRAQSPHAVALALDKRAQKRFFDAHGYDTPRWGTRRPPAEDGRVLIKRREGTQSRCMRFAADGESPDVEEIWEAFEEGREYSVVAWLAGPRTVVLPTVDKGLTSESLVPPWRRLRICPAPLEPQADDALRQLAAQICRDADVDGHCEVEFVRRPDGSFCVLELNPRAAGTMRVSALAAGVPLFSLDRRPRLEGLLPARGFAAEAPYDGPPIVDVEQQVFGTSRLTVGGRSREEVEAKLARLVGDLPR